MSINANGIQAGGGGPLASGSRKCLVSGLWGRALMRIFLSGHQGRVRVLFVTVAMFPTSSEKIVRETRRRSYLKSCSFGTSVSFPPLESPDLSYTLRGLISSTCILLDTSDRNPWSEIPWSTVLWGYTDTAGWHPQLSACWVGTNQITNRPAWNPEFSVTLLLFPRHLPGRCCKHRELTLDWSPTVDEIQVPLPRELTVLRGEV